MSIDLVKEVYAAEIEIDDELDLDGDEYGDNEQAMFAYAVVQKRTSWFDEDGYLWITFETSQGNFDVPENHLLKLKVIE